MYKPVKLTISAASEVGLVRRHNEDMILVGDRFIRDDEFYEECDLAQKDRLMLALADGMGGHNAGDVASRDVLENLHYFYGDLPRGLQAGEFNEAIFGWMDSINNIIDSKGHADPCYLNMGTTLVALAYYEGQFYWMNCGDSRFYRLHEGRLRQISTDHSLNNLMGSSKHSNLITNCIGGGCKMSYIDMVNCTADVLPGDMFMLCSDGLSDMIDDSAIEQLLMGGASAADLCQAAVKAGGYDNVSTCVITMK